MWPYIGPTGPVTFAAGFGFRGKENITMNIGRENRACMNQLASKFVWKNLPEEIPSRNLEMLIQQNGTAFYTEEEARPYVFYGSPAPPLNEFYEADDALVANAPTGIFKQYKIGVDGVLIRNNTYMTSTLSDLTYYNTMLVHAELTLYNELVAMRAMLALTAPDAGTYESAKAFVDKLEDGELDVITDTGFFADLKNIAELTATGNRLMSIVEAMQYIKARRDQRNGMSDAYNMKREYVSADEVGMNEDVMEPQTDDELERRREAANQINEMYDRHFEVDLGSIWLKKHVLVHMETEVKPDDTLGTEEEPASEENPGSDE